MSKLDKIEKRLNESKKGMTEWRYAYVDDFDKSVEYLIQVARKAKEMANFYAAMPENNVEFKDYQNMVEQYAANETNKIGYKAREFLSFLEKGDE